MENRPILKQKKIIVTLALFSFLIWIVVSLIGWTSPRDYGPYLGKIVDKDTGEPLEGVVVFMRFFTVHGTLGGEVSTFADAVETATDEKGEFEIAQFTLDLFRWNESWKPYGSVIACKPGYGAYPKHQESGPDFIPNGTLPENKYVTLKLPKLKTIEERYENLRNIGGYEMEKIPLEKQRKILELYNSESKALGLPLVMTK